MFALVAIAGLFLTSCSYVDQFGARAVSYNIEAEQVKDQNLVLNIVRAAYRRPMQFTDLSTISGQGTASFTGGLSLLLGAAPSASSVANAASPSATWSGGPTFAVGTLNTKEFYEGILAPIQLSTINYYVSQGFPLRLLLSLLIFDIDIGPADEPRPSNDPDAMQHKWDRFQDKLDMLLDRGLSVETVPSIKPIGPPLTSDQARDPAMIASLNNQNFALVEHPIDKPDANLSATDRAILGGKDARVYYRIEQDDSSPRFCFRQAKAMVGVPIGNTRVVMDAGFVCGAHTTPSPTAKPAGRLTLRAQAAGSEAITLKTRSVEGVIYWLGEIARAELNLGTTNPSPFVPNLKDWPYQCRKHVLFSIVPRAQPKAISTTYDGVTYSIPVDPDGCDRSAQVLEIVTQLLALNSSAKDLPTPNIIPLITR